MAVEARFCVVVNSVSTATLTPLSELYESESLANTVAANFAETYPNDSIIVLPCSVFVED